MFRGERRKRDLDHLSTGSLDRLEFLPQRMAGSDLVAAIGTDQHQMPQIRACQQILQQIEATSMEPLQVVEKERQWMFCLSEHADEPPKCQLEPPARVLGREIRRRRLVSDDEFQFRNELDDEPSVGAEGVAERIAPERQLGFALSQKSLDQALKRL